MVASHGQPLRRPNPGAQNGSSDRAPGVKILSSHDLSDGRCIEQLQDDQGNILYRVCGGGVCRYCEDLWMAHLYADQMCPERRASG